MLLPVVSALALDESQPDRSIEAQRNYDLAVSYMKSGLYTKGLETLNQVAFLYPDSDVADDALYQLALLCERAGNDEINLGKTNAGLIDSEMVNKVNLNFRYAPNTNNGLIQGILHSLNDLIVMSEQKKMVIGSAKIKAVNEYLSAIDYLNTAFERYPESDIDPQMEKVYQRITDKLDKITNPINIKPTNTKPTKSSNISKVLFISIMTLGILAFMSIIYHDTK
jgi:tetratricopeptide (TPR) repeat protein